MDLVDALDATGGVVAVVGAGGKKSTMYRLGGMLERPVLTATVRIPIFDRHVARVVVTDDPTAVVRSTDTWPLGVVPAREGKDRYLGYDPSVIDDLAREESIQTILVKADGARMRKFKAPGSNEPRIPTMADVVVPVVSAHVIGEPLSSERVHRVERVAALTGLARGQILSPETIARVIGHPDGGYKSVPNSATVIPVVNMVDDAVYERRARTLAGAILDEAPCDRVVLTQLTADEPVVAVVER